MLLNGAAPDPDVGKAGAGIRCSSRLIIQNFLLGFKYDHFRTGF